MFVTFFNPLPGYRITSFIRKTTINNRQANDRNNPFLLQKQQQHVQSVKVVKKVIMAQNCMQKNTQLTGDKRLVISCALYNTSTAGYNKLFHFFFLANYLLQNDNDGRRLDYPMITIR